MSELTEEQEVGIWRQVTGLNVTAVRHKPPSTINADGSISVVSVWRETTADGMQLVPSDRVELQIDGKWPEQEPEQLNGVYTVTAGTTSLTLHPDE